MILVVPVGFMQNILKYTGFRYIKNKKKDFQVKSPGKFVLLKPRAYKQENYPLQEL